MKIEDLIEKIEFEFEDVPKGFIKPSTEFTAIENWGSMHSLILIALADTEYDVVITGGDLKGLNSVQDLFNLIVKKSV